MLNVKKYYCRWTYTCSSSFSGPFALARINVLPPKYSKKKLNAEILRSTIPAIAFPENGCETPPIPRNTLPTIRALSAMNVQPKIQCTSELIHCTVPGCRILSSAFYFVKMPLYFIIYIGQLTKRIFHINQWLFIFSLVLHQPQQE